MAKRMAVWSCFTGILFIVLGFIFSAQASGPTVAGMVLTSTISTGAIFLIIAAICWAVQKRT